MTAYVFRSGRNQTGNQSVTTQPHPPRLKLPLAVLMCWLATGTDVLRAASALEVTLVGTDAGLRWESVPGNTYLVQSRDSLSTGDWITNSVVIAEDNPTTWLDPAPLVRMRFYRLLMPDGERLLFESPPEPPPAMPGEAFFKSVGGLKLKTELTDYPEGGGVAGIRKGVHAFSGEFTLASVDLRVPGRGMDFIWARKYRSRIGPDTAQGSGWDFAYNIFARRVSSHVEVHDGNTRRDIFLQQPDGTFACAGFFREGSISNNAFTLMLADKGTWEFNPFDSSVTAGKIRQSTDRNGNAMRFEYDGLGRLARVIDTVGRTVLTTGS